MLHAPLRKGLRPQDAYRWSVSKRYSVFTHKGQKSLSRTI